MTENSKRRPLGAADVAVLFLCGALALLILVVAAVPRVMGLTAYAISSDSMSPILRRGDLVFAGRIDFDELHGGEIIIFETEGGLLTHRVYEIDPLERSLRTKADASAYLDAQSVEERALLGRVVYKLPLLGQISLMLGRGGASQ
ncbi:MAG TPA: signal peptidase I [Pseudoflavonifractor sp.]|nr:signal peptidase I [Pseudoflavonifractor sp.]